MRRRRTRRAAAALVSLATLLILITWWRSRDPHLPHHLGHSVRWWFLEFCRTEAGRRGGWPMTDVRGVEARIALLELGTNALPFLVQEAFTFKPDPPWRTNLIEFSRQLPEWLGGGGLVLQSERNHSATLAIRYLRPPASALMPLLESRLNSGGEMDRRQGVFLLGALGEGSDVALPYLETGLTNTTDPWLSSLAAQSLEWLGTRLSDPLPTLLATLQHQTRNPRTALRAIARLGPPAREALPLIEPLLTQTNFNIHLDAAFALLQIQPDHPEALRVCQEAISGNSRDTLFSIISRGPKRRSDALLSWLEPLARAETDRWGAMGASFRATAALERIAPERAMLLYQRAAEGPGKSYAAQAWLRLDRTNAEATALLLSLASQPSLSPSTSHFALWAVSGLAEASSDNAPAISALQAIAQNATNSLLAKGAQSSLARIRYRELRAKRGLGEEWE